MPFFFNPCAPCCKIPDCLLCVDVSLPRSWNVHFNGVSGKFDNGTEPCTYLFPDITATFDAKYDTPCRWHGTAAQVTKNCRFGSVCYDNKCICDCSDCFDLVVGPVWGAINCDHNYFGGGWIKLWGGGFNCSWSGGGFPGVGANLILHKDISPPTLTLSIAITIAPGDYENATATYTTGTSSCEDVLEFDLASQVNAPGSPAPQWPPKVKAYRASCTADLPLCLCTYCDTNFTVDVSELKVKQAFVDDYLVTINKDPFRGQFLDGDLIAWPGGDVLLQNYQISPGNPPIFFQPCWWRYLNESGNVGANGFNLYAHPAFFAQIYLYPSVIDGGFAYRRALSLGVQTHFTMSDVFSSFPFQTWFYPSAGAIYTQDNADASSDCDDYDTSTWTLQTDTTIRTPGFKDKYHSPCGLLRDGAGSAIGPFLQNDAMIEFPGTVTLKKSPKPTSLPPCPNPYLFGVTTIDVNQSVNTANSKQFTNDTLTVIDISVVDGKLEALVKVTFNNRCKDPQHIEEITDSKVYSISLDDFNCLSSNVLTREGGAAGNICSWPPSLTLTP